MVPAFRVIAHRGASAHAPENTVPAFLLAEEQGAREVELDVRFSSDLEIVVFHDDTLDRKTSRSGRVAHYSAAQLRRTDIGSWFDDAGRDPARRWAGTSIATLDEVFEAMGDRVGYHIEIKGFEDLLPLRLMQLVDARGLAGRVTITSFSMKPLLQVRELEPGVPICLLLRDAADALRSAEFRPALIGLDLDAIHRHWIDAAADAGFQQAGIRARDLRAPALAHAADRGLDIRGWGVGDEDDLRHLVDLGAIGATVDWPARAIEIVAEPRRP